MAAALIAVAVAGVLAATHTNPATIQPKVDIGHLPILQAAPPIAAQGWVNSPPLDPAALAGKVVVYDFWTYSCVNCVRTFPYVRAWYDRYRRDGLVIVGIHSPEFDFEKNHANVMRAVSDLGVTWPVALDDNMATWSAFFNNSWPADYIADRNNRERYYHAGEGDYQQTEDVIRTLLGVPPGAPRAAAPNKAAATGGLPDVTPETYLGTQRGTGGNKDGPTSYPDPGTPAVDTAALSGDWTSASQYVQAGAAGSAVVLHYQAREVNLVLGPAAGAATPVDLLVELDAKPLPAAYRTRQTIVDDKDRTLVRVDHPDMYRLVLGPAVEGHVLRLTAQGPGLLAYSFTFGA